jgi:hypothetical protein
MFRKQLSVALSLFAAGMFAATASAQWVTYANETGARVDTSQEPATGGSLGDGVFNVHEKDYAWDDIDKDGDIDLIIVNKGIGTTRTPERNAILMNEGGVLVDRTTQYGSASTVTLDGGGLSQGMLDETNDRDVVLVDVNGDTWLDIITATTLSGSPAGSNGDKPISHSRVYINLGEDMGGNWLGFIFDDEDRMPTMAAEPRFCSVSVGDLDMDGDADVYMGDYQQGGARDADLNDRLFFNDGNGYFTDASTTCQGPCPNDYAGCPIDANARLTCEQLGSSFAMSTEIVDINNDGLLDILKDDALNAPQGVSVSYNNLAGDPARNGYFENDGGVTAYEIIYGNAPYHIAVGDLNMDGWKDLAVVDDNQDRYQLSQGVGANGKVIWAPSQVLGGSNNGEFGGNVIIRDLNNDGFSEVLVANVDVDLVGSACVQSSRIFRNMAEGVGASVTLTSTGFTNESIGIASADMIGGHDIAVFDINGDNWLDLVIGNCVGTNVYINQPPTASLAISLPSGPPSLLSTDTGTAFDVTIDGINGGSVTTANVHYDLGSGFVSAPLTALGGNSFEANIPAGTCLQDVAFYITAEETGGSMFSEPSTAPAVTHTATPVSSVIVALQDDIEGSVAAWSVQNDASLTTGAWEQADPIGTQSGGTEVSPDVPFNGTMAWVTANCPPGGCASSGETDVDGGPTTLMSPVVDIDGSDAIISYARWHYSSGDDTMSVDVTANAQDGVPTWVTVETVPTSSNSWDVVSFRVSNYVTPSANVRVRWVVSDNPNNNVVEAGLDRFHVEELVCDECENAGECDDGVFCNGVEDCDGSSCVAGGDPCPGQMCEEAGDSCVDCIENTDCDDGSFCNGVEACAGNTCTSGSDPCAGQFCDEGLGCVTCLNSSHCDDGLFCNGFEVCQAGGCNIGIPPCPGGCDDVNDVCTGPLVLQPHPGDPVLGLDAAQLDAFNGGKEAFIRVFAEDEGLGPVFNQASCASCHNNPVGGSGTQTVTRFGIYDPKDNSFDPLAALGGSLLQAQTISPMCAEVVPPEATWVTTRSTPSVLGGGLIEAVEDSVLQANADFPPSVDVSGRIHMVQPLEDPTGPLRVGRFGWKSQVATLMTFAGDAGLNEMGITNDLVPNENAPNGDAAVLANCDTIPDPEDVADPGDGLRWIDRTNTFMRLLAAPPQTPRYGMSGEGIFTSIGCADCHISTMVTSNDVALEDALRSKVIKPYSDFLIHEMGLLFDGVADGAAEPGEVRTASLWGLRIRDPLLHDASIAGGTFEDRVTAAIVAHGQSGSEAKPSVDAFQALSPGDTTAVLAFLDSLGRLEFDYNGDGIINFEDYNVFDGCYTGPGSFYTPDDHCSIGDVDQDGDIDDDDLAFLLTVLEDCCDLDGDGIRNDVCVWCDSTDGCNNVPLTSFADVGGAFGACSIDGFTNVHDRNHVLTCFAGTNPCRDINMDAGGAFGSCVPDGFCNVHDANLALNVFAGLSTCTCPSGPMPEFDPIVVGGAELLLARSNSGSTRKGEIHVDVFVSGKVALQGYQLEVVASGGRDGDIELVDIVIEDRKDHVFAGRNDWFDAANTANGQMLSALEANEGVTLEGRTYLATYVFRTTAEASGRFVFDVLTNDGAGDQTFLVAPDDGKIEILGVSPAIVDPRTR